jgi:para-aminobenzoate synthetase component 1
MAAEVRRLLANWGMAVEARRLTVEDLLAADHVFLTNSLLGAVPVVSLEDQELRYHSALCDKLNRAVFDET